MVSVADGFRCVLYAIFNGGIFNRVCNACYKLFCLYAGLAAIPFGNINEVKRSNFVP